MRASRVLVATLLAALGTACAGATPAPARAPAHAHALPGTAPAPKPEPVRVYAVAPEATTSLHKEDSTVFDRGTWTQAVAIDAAYTGGTRSADEVRRAVQRRAARIHRCYDRALVDHPNARGKLVVRWRVSARGAVDAVRIVTSTIHARDLHSCVLREIRRLRFRPSRSGATDDVEFPLLFTPRM